MEKTGGSLFNRQCAMHIVHIVHVGILPSYLDDQHRNTNMNDKDHLVGQLTTVFVQYHLYSMSYIVVPYFCFNLFLLL